MADVMQALTGARGYLRRELATRIPLRTFPQLRFRWDFSQERGSRIDELLDMLATDQDNSEAELDEA